MKRLLLLLLSLPALAGADALLPDALGDFVRGETEALAPSEAELFAEFGFEEGQAAVFETPGGESSRVSAWRFYDDTGAYSAYLWLKPREGEPAVFGERGWRGPEATWIHFGNYVIRIEGSQPLEENVELMLAYLPRIRLTADPPVVKFLPAEDLVAGSERHLLGPVGLENVAPEIPPSAAAFHFGSEAHAARYQTGGDSLELLLFSYPAPQMAREQIKAFRGLEGVLAKRSGSLIAAVIAPPSSNEAQRLLARVRYEADVTLDEGQPGRHEDVGSLILDILILCGILIALCIVGGVLVASARLLASRYAPDSIFAAPQGDGMTRLRIDNRE